jgi:zinc protease
VRRFFVAPILVLAWLALAVPWPGGEARASLFKAEFFTLGNGMQVVVIPNHRAPIVVHMVWYRVGAADDPLGKSGIAHFLEHLMFKGTKTYGPGEFSRIVAEQGGRENAFTSADYTGYYQHVARDRLEIVMALEADRMRNLVLIDEIVLPERDVILEERNSRTDSDPAALLGEQISAAQYLRHPYGTPIIGWRHEIMQLERQDALDFYRLYYAPNNAILVVAGDITAEELRPLAEIYYGAIATSELSPRKRATEPPPRSPRRVKLSDPRVAQPSISRSYLAPSYRAGETDQALPLQVLVDILGRNSTSRLYQRLVVEQGLAAWAGASYHAMAVDQTSFQVYAAAMPNTSIVDVEAAVDAVLDELLADGVTDEEVAAAKARMQAQALYALDNPQMVARIFGNALSVGLTVADVESWPDDIGAVTTEQVNAAARAVLRPERSVTGMLLPNTDG